MLGLGIVIATIVVVLMVQAAARALLRPEESGNTKDLAGSVLFRIAALHGLVLALVFASEVVEYNQIEFEVEAEVNAVSDLFYDIERYGADQSAPVQAHLRAYLDAASTSEWQMLGQAQRLDDEVWAIWDAVYTHVLDLEPQTPRQSALRDHMLHNVNLIADKRDLREHHAKSGLGQLFWWAALLGVALVSVGYFVFPINCNNVVLLCVFGGYTGFILFTILAMSNPFSAPGALQTTLFQDLLVELNDGAALGS